MKPSRSFDWSLVRSLRRPRIKSFTLSLARNGLQLTNAKLRPKKTPRQKSPERSWQMYDNAANNGNAKNKNRRTGRSAKLKNVDAQRFLSKSGLRKNSI
jgi:hypothetical protein